MKQSVIIHSDGACKGNPGLGGYGAILQYKTATKKIYGVEENTTNNRMELKAVIEALKILKRSCIIEIFTDSQYVQKGMNTWIHSWKLKNWKGVKNPELWQELDCLSQKHQITWHWVRGHSGHDLNEQADELANFAIQDYLTNIKK